jgi:hypothetical protein
MRSGTLAARSALDAVKTFTSGTTQRGGMSHDDDHYQALVELAAHGDTDAIGQVVELAAERGDMERLRRLADAGSKDAVDQLVELAQERDDRSELRRLADSGNRDAADILAEMEQEDDDATG